MDVKMKRYKKSQIKLRIQNWDTERKKGKRKRFDLKNSCRAYIFFTAETFQIAKYVKVHFSLSLCLSISLSLYLSLYLPLIHVSISSFEFLFFIHFYFQLLTFFSVCLSTVFFLPISFSFFLSSFWFFAFLSFFCLRCLHKWTRKRLLLKR